MGVDTARCPVCGLRFVPDPRYPHTWCLHEHPPGECCHVAQLVVDDDGTHHRAALSPYCIPVDV
jgi:hypothetical protein